MKHLTLLLLIWAGSQEPAVQESSGSCMQCHLELADSLLEPVRLSQQDIHFQKGISCHDCHGGDPTVGFETGEVEDAKDPSKGYVGRPGRREIAALCATCHSQLEYMRKYNPQARVDQFDEYLTSIHGEKIGEGDLKVATCTDCHGVHGTRAVDDPNSAVYPTNVASTCARCHADKELISTYGIPTDQVELYNKSIHGETLIKERDISAPTCNDCHGNHGATPPGVDSVANVCGQCHVSQWDLFDQSPHKGAFADFDFPACVTCHEHHAVARTSEEMLGVEDTASCVICQDEGSTGYTAAAEMKSGIIRLEGLLEAAHLVLERAERAGMEVSSPIYELSEGRDRLVRARVVTHRFDTAALNEILQEGEKIAREAEQSGWQALDDLSFRRKGLAVSAVILLCMIGLLVAKIRQVSA
jgi:hypothetical protein